MKAILMSIRPEWVAKILNGNKTIEYATLYLINRIQSIYRNMYQRCYNPKSERYERYGGRGIKICDEWLGLKGRDRFVIWAFENGYQVDYSIERIDVDKDYCPSNCKWIPKNLQSKNKSNTHWITHNGETKCLEDWCKELNLKSNTIMSRVRNNGIDFETAIFNYHRPVKNGKATCPRGHLYTEENTGWTSQGYRYCKECVKLHRQDYNARRRELRRMKKNG